MMHGNMSLKFWNEHLIHWPQTQLATDTSHLSCDPPPPQFKFFTLLSFETRRQNFAQYVVYVHCGNFHHKTPQSVPVAYKKW